MLCKTKTADDYAFGFNAIKKGMQSIHTTLFEPPLLMSDADPAIHNGYVRVFGSNTKILMCYVHMKRNVDKNKSKLMNKENLEAISNDISQLKLSYNKTKFDIGCQLFLDKWNTEEPTMADYINNYWFKRNMNWYNGATVRTPTDNNTEENFNGKMKVYDTEFKRKGLNQFKEMMLDIVSNRSREYVQDKKPYQSEVVITKQTLQKGFEYSKIKKVFDRSRSDGKHECFMLKGDNSGTLTEDRVNSFFNETYNNFNDFSEHMFDIYHIVFESDPNAWKMATCTCPVMHMHMPSNDAEVFGSWSPKTGRRNFSCAEKKLKFVVHITIGKVFTANHPSTMSIL